MQHFFDLDETLLDHATSQRGGIDALGNFSPKMRAHLHDQFLQTWQDAETRHFLRYQRNEISMAEQRRERLRECFPDVCGVLADDALDNLYAIYLDGYRASWSLYPESIEVLSQLPGPKALITNGDSKLQRAKVETLGLGSFFQGIYVSGELGFSKPDVRIFIKACEDLGLTPSETRYVGDNFLNDIEGSSAAGLRPVWINRAQAPRPETAISFVEIRSLTELLA
jgi:putative hydrolase of the HAD superfamily